MKFIDKTRITIRPGNGGCGAISFRREKYVPKGGPDGGKGGRGGNVILQATSKVQTLTDIKIHKHYFAKNGRPGKGKNQTGANGQDTVILVPPGTIVFDENKNIIDDLTTENSKAIIARGGKGGLGNSSFSTSVNRTPRYAQPGEPGEEKTIILELRLLADVGIIGLPNSGKSTLLKALTCTNPKIADYPFTTIHPNLGMMRFIDCEIIITDIPGLIEGASEGLGLGHDFLRHIDRSRLLVHLISTESSSPEQCWKDYTLICNELKNSEYNLTAKKIIIALSKTDLPEESCIDTIIEYFKSKGINVLTISSFSQRGLNMLKEQIKMVYLNEKKIIT
ncbi:MAG: GTPase ObgE [bacterium]|nr:GTPase ObgE [bacterium]